MPMRAWLLVFSLTVFASAADKPEEEKIEYRTDDLSGVSGLDFLVPNPEGFKALWGHVKDGSWDSMEREEQVDHLDRFAGSDASLKIGRDLLHGKRRDS